MSTLRGGPSFPDYSRAERAADAIVHLAGILFGIAGAVALIVAGLQRLPAHEIAGLGVYGSGLVGMFTASASYNLVRRPSIKEWLRRVDHAVIFLMIAGSYTPIALRMGGNAGAILLAAVWGIALAGVAVKLVAPRKLDRVSILLYLAQGWCVIFALGPLVEAVPSSSLDLLIAGGCLYTAGVVFHLLDRLPFHNVIWHIFVLGGAVSQYASIYGAIIR